MSSFLLARDDEYSWVTKIMAVIITACIAFVLIASGLLWSGFVVHKLYYWLLVPAFPSLPLLTLPHVIALRFVMPLFFARMPAWDYEKDKNDKWAWAWDYARSMFQWALVLLVGWIIYMLIP